MPEHVAVWMDTIALSGERAWRLYETDVLVGSYESVGFFRVRMPGTDRLEYYQDPISYVQHRHDQGIRVELLTVDLELWRARRRTFHLKRALPEESEEDP